MEKILFVDDDPRLLESIKRSLRVERTAKAQFSVDTAVGAEQALLVLDERGPFAVLVSDLRMPGMDGVRFLSIVRERFPDTVRIMLTGQADTDAAIDAVNQGNIFRFLTKPCSTEALTTALEAALAQYHLVTAERVLLEQTLGGCVQVLVDILSLVSPLAFSQAFRVRRYVRHIAQSLGLGSLWQFEVAAMLSQIGTIGLPQEILDKAKSGQPLTQEEDQVFSSHPAIASKLLVHIPRFDAISEMISRQMTPPSTRAVDAQGLGRLGGQMLRVAIQYDQLLATGLAPQAVLEKMREQPDQYNPVMVGTLDSLVAAVSHSEIRALRVDEITSRMVLEENVFSREGLLLLMKGMEVSDAMLERLRAFALEFGVQEPIRVSLPK